MNFVLDLTLVAICFLVVFFSVKRGFIRSVMGFASKIAAFVVAYTFTPAISEYIKTHFLLPKLADSIAATLRSTVTVSDGFDFTGLAEKIPSILERYLISGEELTAKIDSMEKTGEEALRFVSEQIADKVSGMISSALAFVGLFAATCLVLWLVTLAADALFKLPVLRTANKALGAVFGVCSAILITLVYCNAVSMLVGALGAVAPKIFGADVLEKTILVKFFANESLLNIAKNLFS